MSQVILYLFVWTKPDLFQELDPLDPLDPLDLKLKWWPITGKKLKIKHMWRRWGITKNFFLAFTDEQKQIFIKKTAEVGQ